MEDDTEAIKHFPALSAAGMVFFSNSSQNFEIAGVQYICNPRWTKLHVVQLN